VRFFRVRMADADPENVFDLENCTFEEWGSFLESKGFECMHAGWFRRSMDRKYLFFSKYYGSINGSKLLELICSNSKIREFLDSCIVDETVDPPIRTVEKRKELGNGCLLTFFSETGRPLLQCFVRSCDFEPQGFFSLFVVPFSKTVNNLLLLGRERSDVNVKMSKHIVVIFS